MTLVRHSNWSACRGPGAQSRKPKRETDGAKDRCGSCEVVTECMFSCRCFACSVLGTILYGPRPQHRKQSQHLSHDLRRPAILIRCDAAGPSVQLRCVDENAARSSAYAIVPRKKHQKPHAQYHSPHPVGLGTRPNTSTISIVQCPAVCLDVCNFCDVHNAVSPGRRNRHRISIVQCPLACRDVCDVNNAICSRPA